MTKQEIMDTLYEVRWYISEEWGVPEQQDNAKAAISRAIDATSAALSGGSCPDLPDPPDPPDGPGEFPNLKVALLVGHNRSSPGAWVVGDGLSESEYVFHNQIAELIREKGIPGVEFRRFNRTPGGGYSSEINRVYLQIDNFAPDLVIDMHFNGGGGDYGMVMYHYLSKTSRKVADAMSAVLHSELEVVDRDYNSAPGKESVPQLEPGENGYYSMKRSKSPSVLLEPFFGDRREHGNRIAQLGHGGYSDILIKSITAGLNALQATG